MADSLVKDGERLQNHAYVASQVMGMAASSVRVDSGKK